MISLVNTGPRIPSARLDTNPSILSVENRSSQTDIRRRLRSSTGTYHDKDSRPVAGRYEEAALPDYGIDRLYVTLDPALLHSYLTVKNIDVYSQGHNTRLAFDRPRQIGVVSGFKPRRVTAALISVCDRQFDLGKLVRAFGIETPVVIGKTMIRQHLWVTAMPVRSTDLVLGADALSGHYRIDSDGSFHLGQPSHSFIGLLRSRARDVRSMAASAIPAGPFCKV